MAKPPQLKPKFKEELKKGKTIKEAVKPFGEAAMKEYQKSISPQGMAKFQADAKKALEKKYPGMFIPQTRTTPGVKKNGKK
jgi:hypothetical protein